MPTGRGVSKAGAAAVLVMIAATVVFAESVVRLDPRDMNGLGLVSILPVSAVLALLAVNVSFCLTLQRGAVSGLLLLMHVLALMFMVYGVATLVEGVTHYQATYRHTGIIDHLLRAKGIDGSIDAYFDWPGFFAFGSLLVGSAGIHSALTLTPWASLYTNLLFLIPLVLILRALTTDRKLIWLSVWIYTLTNWVGQDYFSPQSFSYFLYLTLIAIVLRWFPRGAPPLRRLPAPFGAGARLARLGRRLSAPRAQSSPAPAAAALGRAGGRGAAGVFGLAMIIVVALVPSHQLTPTGAVLATASLVLVGACRLRLLPVLMLLLAVAWVAYMAVPYLESHIVELADSVGALGQNVNASVGSRLGGDAQHLLIVRVRLYATLIVWALAAAGMYMRWRTGRGGAAAAALFIAPFALLGLQPYGGEISLRVYYLALPFAAFGVAGLLRSLPAPAASEWKPTATVVCATTVLLCSLLFTRYGNEASDFYTRQEITAVRTLYRVAPPGALVYGEPNAPWRFARYIDYDYRLVSDVPGFRSMRPDSRDAQWVVDRMAATMQRDGRPHGAYLFTTRSGPVWLDLLEAPAGRLESVEAAVERSPRFRLIYANRDARMYRFVSAGRR